VWVADVHSNDIIPRGYDLSTPLEIQAFIDDFRFQKAEGWLKAVYRKLSGINYTDSDGGKLIEIKGIYFYTRALKTFDTTT
jgi:hypothetical protein